MNHAPKPWSDAVKNLLVFEGVTHSGCSEDIPGSAVWNYFWKSYGDDMGCWGWNLDQICTGKHLFAISPAPKVKT